VETTRGLALFFFWALAIVMTWPLAQAAGTRLAGDLGDPAFNCWVLAWTSGQVLAAFRGDFGALANFWNGNIFYPEPLTLAYSEHLFGLALPILPVYAATGNILLAYNLLFIATFAMSGYAAYLLVRDLTGETWAGLLGGLAFAYAPYRLGQFSHLQVLTSYWMPLALFGLRRFFVTGRTRALAGGSAALVMQNLSCGYYLLFFSPFVAAYCLYEMVQRRLLRDGRVWTRLGLAAIVVALATWPFVRPYLQVRDTTGVGVRSRAEIAMFSADTHAFATIAPNSRTLAEPLAGFPKPEGEGFVGFTILAFGLVGLGCGITRIIRTLPWASMREWHVIATAGAGIVFLGSALVVLWFFVHGSLSLPVSGEWVIYRNATRPLRMAFGSLLLFVGLSTWARRGSGNQPDLRVRGFRDQSALQASETAFGFFAIAFVAAAFFALGPSIEARGRVLGAGPYTWLLDFLPGFDGLRVPARFLMLSALFLSVLAGLGAKALLATRWRQVAIGVIAAGMAGIVTEAWVAPMRTNQPVIPDARFFAPEPPAVGRRMNPIYRVVRQLPGSAVLIEFPFGESAYEILAVFHAGEHRRRLVNGYSGFFPRSYTDRVAALYDVTINPKRAADVLLASGATHVLVHEGAYTDGKGSEVSDWLVSLGAKEVTSHGTDHLYAIK
jgi:hypothetical protein